MKVLAFLLILGSQTAFAGDLSGRWQNSEDGTIVNFIAINGNLRQYNSANYNYPNGRLAYKIDQAITIPHTGGDRLQGKVDFYDSRGCTFKDLPVFAEFQNENTVNFLLTVPRYKFQTITQGRSVRHACRVLEYVEVPVELIRL
ncbi:MAG: hypothetical protein V4598_02705 [Bdellovibrionota bacterium]